MTTEAYNPFKGINESSKKGYGYFKPGHYELTVDYITVATNFAGIASFLVEFVVDKSDNPEIPAGTKRTWMQKLAPDTIAKPVLKAFISELCGLSPEQEKTMVEELCNKAISKDNPLKGTKVKVEFFMKKTKSGGDWTEARWQRVAAKATA